MKERLDELNREQKEAASHLTGACMVLAGPGTGKTTVITARIRNMISAGIPPKHILVVTFSRAAANEMKERYLRLGPEQRRDSELITFGTFHSVFFRILRQYRNYRLEDLIDEEKKYSLIRTIIKKNKLDFGNEEDELSDLINDMGYIVNAMLPVEDYEPKSCRKKDLRLIIEAYEELKENSGLYDYDDLLFDCYQLLQSNTRILKEIRERFRYILIDEFQDINRLQFETIRLIAEPVNNIFVVGDDDQSIYGFRGATPDILLNFERLYPNGKRIVLKRNYRTHRSILNCAQALIGHNKARYAKGLEAVRSKGYLPQLLEAEDFEEEARKIADRIKTKRREGITYSKMAVIYRTNLQSRALIDALMDGNIPFIAVDGAASVYHHWVAKDILGYLQLSLYPYNNKEIQRVMNKPKRFISRDSIERADSMQGSFYDNLIAYGGLHRLQANAVMELRENIHRMSDMKPAQVVKFVRSVIGYDEYIREYAYNKGISVKGLMEAADEIESSTAGYPNHEAYLKHVEEVLENAQSHFRQSGRQEDRVQLLTMHRAKGLEFDVVFISGSVDGLTPYFKAEDAESMDEEEERRLFYVAMTRAKNELYISTPKLRYKKAAAPSRFIKELVKGMDLMTQVQEGQKVFHKIFYDGIIRKVSEAPAGVRISVEFDGTIKDMDLGTCLKNELIKLL